MSEDNSNYILPKIEGDSTKSVEVQPVDVEVIDKFQDDRIPEEEIIYPDIEDVTITGMPVGTEEIKAWKTAEKEADKLIGDFIPLEITEDDFKSREGQEELEKYLKAEEPEYYDWYTKAREEEKKQKEEHITNWESLRQDLIDEIYQADKKIRDTQNLEVKLQNENYNKETGETLTIKTGKSVGASIADVVYDFVKNNLQEPFSYQFPESKGTTLGIAAVAADYLEIGTRFIDTRDLMPSYAHNERWGNYIREEAEKMSDKDEKIPVVEQLNDFFEVASEIYDKYKYFNPITGSTAILSELVYEGVPEEWQKDISEMLGKNGNSKTDEIINSIADGLDNDFKDALHKFQAEVAIPASPGFEDVFVEGEDPKWHLFNPFKSEESLRWWLSNVPAGAGSSIGFILNMRIMGGALKGVTWMSQSTKAALISIAATNSESVMIGDQVFQHSLLMMVPEYAEGLGQQIEAVYENYGEYLRIHGSKELANYYMSETVKQLVDEAFKRLPEGAQRKIIADAQEARRIAIGTNNLTAVLNYTYARMTLGGKGGMTASARKKFFGNLKDAVSRSGIKRIEAWKGLTMGQWAIIREMLQESYEEGPANTGAELAGNMKAKYLMWNNPHPLLKEKYTTEELEKRSAANKPMSITDYEIMTTEAGTMNALSIGAITAGGQTAVTQFLNENVFHAKSRAGQSRAITKLQKLITNIGDPKLMDKFGSLNAQYENIAIVQEEIERLKAAGSYGKAEELSSNLLSEQARFALQWNAMGNLINYYTAISNEQRQSPEVRKRAAEAVDKLHGYKEMWDATEGKSNRNAIYLNRINNDIYKRQIAENETHVESLESIEDKTEEQKEKLIEAKDALDNLKELRNSNTKEYSTITSHSFQQQLKRKDEIISDVSKHLNENDFYRKDPDDFTKNVKEFLQEKYKFYIHSNILEDIEIHLAREYEVRHTVLKAQDAVAEARRGEEVDVDIANLTPGEYAIKKQKEEILKTIEDSGKKLDSDGDRLLSPPEKKQKGRNEKQKLKEATKKFIDSFTTRFKKTPTFEELIRDAIEVYGQTRVRGKSFKGSVFESIYKGWHFTGQTPIAKKKAQKLYNEMFTAQDDAMNMFETSGETETSSAEQQKKEEQKKEDEKEQKKSKSKKDLKALTKQVVKGFSFFIYKTFLSFPTDAGGYKSVKLLGDPFLSNAFLDARRTKIGDRFDIRVPKNAEGMKITYVHSNGKKEIMTFGELIKRNKLKPEDADYKNYIPMIIYDGTEAVAYLNSPSYFTSTLAEENVFGEVTGNEKRYAIDKAQKNNIKLRDIVHSEGKARIEITKRDYNISNFRKESLKGTVKNKAPNALIGYRNENGKLVTNEGVIDMDDVVLIGETGLKENYKAAYHFVEYKMENGKQKAVYYVERLWFNDPLKRSDQLLDRTSVSSITWALIAYATQFDTTGVLAEELGKVMKDTNGQPLSKENFSKEAMDNLIAHIRKNSKNKDFAGFDIAQVDDLKKYLGAFVITNVSTGSAQEVIKSVNGNNSIKPGTPYIGVGGITVIIGVKGEKTPSGKDAFMMINPGTKKDPISKKAAQAIAKSIYDMSTRPANKEAWKKGMLTKVGAFFRFKINISSHVADLENFPIINANGKMTVTKYKEYIGGKLWSRMSTVKISEKGKIKGLINKTGNSVMNVEPRIDFKLVTEEEKTSSVIDTKEEKKEKKEKRRKEKEKRKKEKEENKKKDEKIEKSIIGQVIDRAIDDLGSWGISVQKPSTNDAMLNPADLNDENTKQKLRDAHSDKTNLLSHQKDAIVNELRGLIVDEIEPGKKISEDKINKIVKKTLILWIANKNEESSESKKELDSLVRKDMTPIEEQLYDAILKGYETVENQTDRVLGNLNLLMDIAWKQAEKDIDIKRGKLTEEEVSEEAGSDEDTRSDEEEQQDNRDTNYTKTSIEENNKAKTPYKLKRFLEGFFKKDRNNKPITTFLGIYERYSADYIYDKIEEILSHNNDVASSFDDMMAKLLTQAKNEPWIEDFIKKISDTETDSDIRMGFVYHFAMHSLRMKVAVYTKNDKGEYSLQVQDSNANEMIKVVYNDWKNKIKIGSLTKTVDQLYAINRDTANKLIKEFEELKRTEDMEDESFLEKARTWLESFGIEMSDEAWTEFVEDGYKYGSKNVDFTNQFKYTSGIFKSLYKTLTRIVSEVGDLTFDDNENNDIFFKTQEIKALARIEFKYSKLPGSKNFRVGDKSIYGYTAPKFATDRAAELRKNEGVLTKLLSMPFSKNSLWLRMLQKSPLFRETFDVEHMGPVALREHSKTLKGVDMGVTKLADADVELAKLAMFTHNNDAIEDNSLINRIGDIPLRVARMFFPTMSDKSQMLTINTAVLDLKSKNMLKDDGHPTYIDIMYEQVVSNELERILYYHENKGTMKKMPDGYALGAQIFHFIPELNNVTDGNGTRIIQLLAEGRFSDEAKKVFKMKAKNVLAQVVLKEKIRKINEWNKFGFVNKDKDGNIKVNALPTDYMRKFTGSNGEKINDFAEEYVINSIISNANIFMSIAGDIAMFSTNKAFERGRFHTDKNGIPIPYSPVSGDIYVKISESVIGVDLGKRLALLLAPGLKIANSKNDKYTQIFISDSIDISPDIVEITRIFYGQTEATKVQEALEGKTKEEQREIADKLAGNYPDISNYFKIESTDGQEYSTMSEHIDIIYRQGRMKQELRDSIIKKYKQQVEITSKGEVIPKSIEFTNEELKVILQPIKPVYTGQVMDENINSARTMYIKTSSFPLISQLTKGTKLDKLRKIMEVYESESGMKVRATFFTGSKVGGINETERLTIDQIESIDETNVDNISESIGNASLVLDRKYFRIQQDVPYKSSKREEDVVALGTQMLKILFGDGILNINDGFFYKGEEIKPDRDKNGNITATSGQKLYNRYAEAFGNLIVQKRKMLYHELGVNEFGEVINRDRTIKNLQRILREEAIEKNYPEQDVKALTLIADVVLSGKDGVLGTYKLSTEEIGLMTKASDIGIRKAQEERTEEMQQEIDNYERDIRPKLERILRKDIVDAIEAGEVKETIEDIDFSIPLWLSPNSNRYESVLNGIVNKRLVKLKIPGNGFVVGSEEGFALENLDVMLNDTEATDDARLTDSIDTLEDLENIAIGKINSKKGDDKYFLLKSQVTKAMMRKYLNKDTKGGARRKGRTYHEIMIHGDYYSHKTIMDWKGNDKIDIVIVDDVKDIEAQYNSYIEGDAKQFTGFEVFEDNLKLVQKEIEPSVKKDKTLDKKDTVEGIPQDQIIWTGKYNGKELQGTLSKVDGTIKYAQVLVPSKLRIKDGITGKMVLVDLFQDFNGTDGLYVKKVGDRIMIKEDMFDADLLDITSFRIPTSSHVSLSQVEIVGFLPPNSGDLMIVPKGFITKKGLDFDVDKEFTYQMWGHQNDDGSFTALDAAYDVEMLEKVMVRIDEHVDAYEKVMKGEYKAYQRLSRDEKNKVQDPQFLFLEKLGKELNLYKTGKSKDVRAENIQVMQDLMNMLEDPKKYNDIYEKVVVNDIIRIHKSVLGNPDDRVQKKVNKVLSTKVAEEQAELLTGTESNKYFTMLSDMYQKEKMNLGSSGRIGIGVYSNSVVMHSLLQQTNTTHQLTPGTNKDLVSHFDIGGLKSNGTLAREDALAGNKKARNRSISEVLAEAQNTATDNEKLQTMGRTNINEYTINVHSIMILLGFDLNWASENNMEISVPYFFLSQPIIKEYVAIMNMHKSILSEDETQYMSPVELKKKVIKNLLARYKKRGEESAKSKQYRSNSNMTADALVDNIKGRPEDVNGFMQMKVLETFAMLDIYAQDLSDTQQKMTVSTKGLGKSLFEAADKFNNVIDLANSSLITGTSNLIGDYMDLPDNNDDIKAAMDNGYVRFNDVMVKPTTPVGSILIHSSKASNDLWNRFFPYNHPDIQHVLTEGLRIFGKEKASTKQKTDAKHTIMKELKKYLFTNSNLGLFSGNASETRKSLFFDDGKHESLANYLDKLSATMQKEGFDDNVRKIMVNNPLLRRFNYTINKNGMPSLIKFNNAAGENLDENSLYNSLVELMLQDHDLPSLNGQTYNTKKLAQDLIAYAYLEGGVQEAVQFAKYISVDYLNITTFGDKTRSMGQVGSTHVSKAMQASLVRLANYIRMGGNEIEAVVNSPEDLKDLESLIQDVNNEYGKNFVMYNSTNQTITFGTQSYNEVLKTAFPHASSVSRFGMQLAQHNPELLRKIKIKNNVVIDENITNADDKSVSKMQTFTYNIVKITPSGPVIDENERPPFLAVYNGKIRKGKKKYHVFYYNGHQYVRIPTLGVFGMNEYDQKKQYQKSDVNKGDLKYSAASKPSKQTRPQPTRVKYKVGKSVETTLELIAKNEFRTETGKVAAIVAQQILNSPALNAEIKVAVKPIEELPDGSKPNGEYIPLVKENNPDRGNIIINSETIDSRSEDKFAATFIEEVLHSITVETIDKYIVSKRVPVAGSERGKWEYSIINGAPDFAIRMVRLFNKTRSILNITDAELAQNTSELLDTKNDNNEVDYERMLEIYRMSNIHEFIAGIFVDKNFGKKLGNITYKGTNLSIIDRFKSIITDMFTAIGINFKRNSIGAQAMDSTLEWLADDTKATQEEEKLDKDEPDGMFTPPDRRSPNEKLEKRLIGFLDKLNVDVHTNGEEVMKTFMKYAPHRNLVGAVDVLEKLIVVNESRKYDTLPRMAAYMIFSLLGKKNHLVKQISNGVRELDNYQDRYQYWKQVVEKQNYDKGIYNHWAHNQVVIEFIADGLMTNFGKDLQPSKDRESEDMDLKFFEKRGLNLHWNRNKLMTFVIKSWYGIQKKLDAIFTPVSKEELHDIMYDLADDIFNGDTKKFMRGAVMKDGYLDVNGEKRMLKDYQDTIDSDPSMTKILNQFTGLGMKLTGSLAFRKFGTVFRSKKESLHDLDFDVLLNMTEKNPREMRAINLLMDKVKAIDEKAAHRYYKKGRRGKVKLTDLEGRRVDRLFAKMEKHIKRTDWFKEVKKMYPDIDMRPAYVNDNNGNHSGITWTGIIDGTFDSKGDHVDGTGYMVDFFISLTATEKNRFDGMFKVWKEIFKAKIRLGRAKDMQDMIAFIPFESSKYKFEDAGFRLFDYLGTDNNYTFVNDMPVRKFPEGPKKC